MTIFGCDISSYQAGLDVARLPDKFVLVKCTEDVGYTDPDYPGWLAAAKGAGKIPVAYHFIGPSDPTRQAAHLAAHIIDRNVPVMVDFEDEGGFHPTLAQLLALDDAITAAGLHVALNYMPRWKHAELGSPSLAPLKTRGIYLVSSAYPNLTVAAAGQVYAAAGGDGGSGWSAYGGMTPLLWQFSDRVADGGQLVDMNAFRGSAAQLAAYLQAPSPMPATTPAPVPLSDPEGDDMPVFETGEIKPGAGVTTVVLPPPANGGAAGWGNVWFSLGSDFGDAHVRITVFKDGVWTDFHEDFVVKAADDRIQPFGAPLSNKVGKISITRLAGSENVPLSYLIEATHR